jgi:hypothetical protein
MGDDAVTFTQLNPTIPLRSDKASGEAIAAIDYSIEHDLMWVIIDDTTGQVWTVPNKDVRAYANYSAGRNLKPEPPTPDAAAVLDAFAAQWIAGRDAAVAAAEKIKEAERYREWQYATACADIIAAIRALTLPEDKP